MDTDGGPQADEADEQGLINDGRLLITDFVHTENADDTEVRRRTVLWGNSNCHQLDSN